jgi:hypothetical protein
LSGKNEFVKTAFISQAPFEVVLKGLLTERTPKYSFLDGVKTVFSRKKHDFKHLNTNAFYSKT